MSDPGRVSVVWCPGTEGIDCSVQHPVKSGKAVSTVYGRIAAGPVEHPTGEARVILQITHADGSQLAAMFNALEFEALCQVMAGAASKAWLMRRDLESVQ
jgi:hypothetical protein